MEYYQIWENKYKNKVKFDSNKFKIIAKIKCRRNTVEEDIKIAEEWLKDVDIIISATENEQLKQFSIKISNAFKNILEELENQKDWYEGRLEEESQKYEELLQKYREVCIRHGE